MDKLIEELRICIYDCRLDVGDSGNNNDDIDCAIEALDKLENQLKNK